MAGRNNWLGRLCLTALGVLGLVMMQAAPAAAQTSQERAKAQAAWQRLEQGWESVREELTRTALETAMTMFFIRWTPPPAPPVVPPLIVVPPPQGQGDPPPPGQGDPPPPSGQGDPPLDVNPPPQSAPEPASIVIALLGAGLAAGCGWRKRRKAVRSA